jgi:hypothetical protein
MLFSPQDETTTQIPVLSPDDRTAQGHEPPMSTFDSGIGVNQLPIEEGELNRGH